MRTLGFIIIDNEKTMAQRFTEDEVRSAALYVKGTPPGPFAMLLAKKDMVLLAFELFRQS
ncbi:hypothetical protein N7516_011369 [Penicillium verrucosum]|uniref:uncharacterized protein n=1 Tax=Penicillium verrucosum TaxID=60171 RepID=UPI0025452B63|nr:uncharacterized protein N7516_011369 [Penicillium verrucosum]KAJ5920511.1 hypothetical protein N7516_011369 [Penicillium verrucosum]